MKTQIQRMIFIGLITVVSHNSAWAHGNEKHGAAPHNMTGGRDVSAATISAPEEAKEAIAVVERFSTALGKGDVAAAGKELDANVIILESGGVERSAAEYLGGHAKGDAEFLKKAHVMLKNRTAGVNGEIVWVASESEIHAMKDNKMMTILSTETMVLKRISGAWKVVHIHWSSRVKK